jgi:cell division protein FtsW
MTAQVNGTTSDKANSAVGLLERLAAWPAAFGRWLADATAAATGGTVGRRNTTDHLPVRDHVNVRSARAETLLAFDQTLVAVVLALVALGVVMVFSASIALSDAPLKPGKVRLADTFYLERHVKSLGVALLAALLVLRIPVSFWEKHGAKIFVGSLLLLVLVLFPAIGIKANKSRRWLPLGLMQFQPSELTKLAIAMYAASYMVRRMETRERFFKAVMPMVVAVAVAGVLLLRQPDVGAFLVILVIAMGILFLGGVNARMFALMTLVIVVTVAVFLYFDDLRRGRILAYLDPWNPLYAAKESYQLIHSLIAIGRGELFGQGLGASVEKLNYLPEAHTDFLLAVIGEELGFVGVASVIALFYWLTRRIFQIGRQAIALGQLFAGLLCQGIGLWMGVQAFINMGVNLGALPTKGLTLPFISFGGSAMLMALVSVAIVVRVDIENRSMMKKGLA